MFFFFILAFTKYKILMVEYLSILTANEKTEGYYVIPDRRIEKNMGGSSLISRVAYTVMFLLAFFSLPILCAAVGLCSFMRNMTYVILDTNGIKRWAMRLYIYRDFIYYRTQSIRLDRTCAYII